MQIKLSDYTEWSRGFDEKVEELKSAKSRFVKHEDMRNESDLTLEDYKRMSGGKNSTIFVRTYVVLIYPVPRGALDKFLYGAAPP